ncbi:MAG TPA: hypothetical protein VE197_02025 [Mycobacterium sp.]|nr:hypothetical protein [Mycobacterium sp.]
MVRQVVVSLVLFVLIGTGVGVWWTRSDAPAYAQGPGHFYVVETSYHFSPSHMVWHVGERISLTLVDEDQSHPPKVHEFLVGRGQLWSVPTPFGHRKLTGGWHIDFFSGVTVSISHGHDVVGLQHPNNAVTGPDAHASWVTRFGHLAPNGPPKFGYHVAPPDQQVVLGGRHGTVTLTFTVPDKPGLWQYGCFHQDALHYLNGMRGTVNVVS